MYPFEETQKFRQWWIWLIIFITVGAGIYAAFYRHDKGALVILVALIIPVLVAWFMWSIRLETKIDEGGVHYRFFPIQRQVRTIMWDEIELAGIRKYSPIAEFGGWGYRTGLRKNGDALNISGDTGLQLVLKNGKKLLVGTQKPDEVMRVLKELGKP